MLRHFQTISILLMIVLTGGCSRNVPESSSASAASNAEQSATDKAIAQSVDKANKTLPKDINGMMRLERVEFVNRTVRYSGIFLEKRKMSAEQIASFEKTMKETYCNGSMKRFAEAKVSLQYVMKTDPDNPKDQPWVTTFSPDKCA